jgi:hypothetical protein
MKLLDGKSGAIKTCYDGILKNDQKAAGKVTVKFSIEKKSGKLVDAQVDPASTTAPAALGQCVLASLNGIVLDPGDRNRGDASWSWSFSAAEAEK